MNDTTNLSGKCFHLRFDLFLGILNRLHHEDLKTNTMMMMTCRARVGFVVKALHWLKSEKVEEEEKVVGERAIYIYRERVRFRQGWQR
jgi:hypothetical protein